MVKHEGMSTHRLSQNPLEAKFAEAWAKLHDGHRKDNGTLEYLLSPTNRSMDTTMTDRDAVVAATVIQWLGSPVGQGFLAEVLGVRIPNEIK